MMSVRRVDRSFFADYYKRAEEFFGGMKDEADLDRFCASALLGIHASIALTDSLTIYECGERSAADQHAKAVDLLKKACQRRRLADREGPNKLTQVLGKKNMVAYGERYWPGDTSTLQMIRLHVDRYFSWAFLHFKEWNKDLKRGENDLRQNL
jgi:hypothetical protein